MQSSVQCGLEMRFPSPPCNLEDSVESSSSTSTATSANLIPQYIVLTVNPVSILQAIPLTFVYMHSHILPNQRVLHKNLKQNQVCNGKYALDLTHLPMILVRFACIHPFAYFKQWRLGGALKRVPLFNTLSGHKCRQQVLNRSLLF